MIDGSSPLIWLCVFLTCVLHLTSSMREASKVIHVAPVATDTADCLPLHVRGALLLPSFTHRYRIKMSMLGNFQKGALRMTSSLASCKGNLMMTWENGRSRSSEASGREWILRLSVSVVCAGIKMSWLRHFCMLNCKYYIVTQGISSVCYPNKICFFLFNRIWIVFSSIWK